jgi:hypothetical protein
MRPSELEVASVRLRAARLGDLLRACRFGPLEMTLRAATVSPGSAWAGKKYRKKPRNSKYY